MLEEVTETSMSVTERHMAAGRALSPAISAAPQLSGSFTAGQGRRERPLECSTSTADKETEAQIGCH